MPALITDETLSESEELLAAFAKLSEMDVSAKDSHTISVAPAGQLTQFEIDTVHHVLHHHTLKNVAILSAPQTVSRPAGIEFVIKVPPEALGGGIMQLKNKILPLTEMITVTSRTGQKAEAYATKPDRIQPRYFDAIAQLLKDKGVPVAVNLAESHVAVPFEHKASLDMAIDTVIRQTALQLKAETPLAATPVTPQAGKVSAGVAAITAGLRTAGASSDKYPPVGQAGFEAILSGMRMANPSAATKR